MMKRTKINIPDAINGAPVKEFSWIPTEVARHPDLSFKAKGLLCLLLSNKDGWYSHITTIQKMGTDGRDGIRSGLKELEKAGYFRIVRYRDIETKQWRGSFWIYTSISGVFDIEKQLEILYLKGLEPEPDFPEPAKPYPANPVLNNINGKNNNNKEDLPAAAVIQDKYITPGMFEKFWKLYPKKVDKGKALTKWEKLCRTPSGKPKWVTIKKAIFAQIQSERWQDPKFIPYPTTWLNQQRWLDDPEEMKELTRRTEQKNRTRFSSTSGHAHSGHKFKY